MQIPKLTGPEYLAGEGTLSPLWMLIIIGFAVLALVLALFFGPRQWGAGIINILGDVVRYGLPMSSLLSGWLKYQNTKHPKPILTPDQQTGGAPDA